MKFSTALTLASVAIGVQSQGAPIGIAPPGGSPPGCISTGSGQYEVTIVKPVPGKRSLEERATCGGDGTLLITLNKGILTDSKGRIGAIVANRQFQFDGPPPQTGSLYTGGWSICGNSSLAIGPTTVFYQCLSGGFYNLYDQPVGAACVLVNLDTIACSGGSSSPPSTSSSSMDSSMTTASSMASASQPSTTTSVAATTTASTTVLASQMSNGTVQATSAVVSQVTDGQVQATATANTSSTSVKPTSTVSTGGAAAFATSGAVFVIGAAAALLF